MICGAALFRPRKIMTIPAPTAAAPAPMSALFGSTQLPPQPPGPRLLTDHVAGMSRCTSIDRAPAASGRTAPATAHSRGVRGESTSGRAAHRAHHTRASSPARSHRQTCEYRGGGDPGNALLGEHITEHRTRPTVVSSHARYGSTRSGICRSLRCVFQQLPRDWLGILKDL